MRRITLALALLLAANIYAIDVRQSQALDGKTLALPPLAPNYDAAKAQLYLVNPLWVAFNQSHGGNWFAQYDTLTGHPRRVLGGAIPWGTDVERAARDFIAANNSVLGVSNDKLRFVSNAATLSRDGRTQHRRPGTRPADHRRRLAAGAPSPRVVCARFPSRDTSGTAAR